MSAAGAGTGTRSLVNAKVRRQKQFIAVGSVVLLALLGFELPKFLGGGGTQASAPAPAATTANAQSGASISAPSSSLPDTGRLTVAVGSGQLVSFGLFKSKDPFVQQLSASASPSGGTGAPALPSPGAPPVPPVGATTASQSPQGTVPNGGPAPVTTTAPAVPLPLPSTTAVVTPVAPLTPLPVTPTPIVPTPTTPTPVTPTPVTTSAPTLPSATPATTPVVTTAPPTAPPTQVSISTNGTCEVVALKGTFPAAEDIFRVISIAGDGSSAEIGVAGGSYDNGQSAATLKLGEKLTLVNTADGARYVLQLETHCDIATQPAVTTTPTSTVAPPAPTPRPITPIVTDALDTTTPGG